MSTAEELLQQQKLIAKQIRAIKRAEKAAKKAAKKKVKKVAKPKAQKPNKYAYLAELHTEKGFKTRIALIAALKSLDAKQKKRAVITPEIRTAAKELLAAGKSKADIARALKISYPSVMNILKK